MQTTRALAAGLALAVLAGPVVTAGCASDDDERPPLATTTTAGPQPTVTTTLPERVTTTEPAEDAGDGETPDDEAG
jgi:hypothetical protein